ncbi:MAG: 5'-nucleotidase C-terminal domain-containing protein, partial [Planctomycetes bacterium]|nr:5'-nucleotidase C-terminal domain-containing protein [Planctomycetota bacterium]
MRRRLLPFFFLVAALVRLASGADSPVVFDAAPFAPSRPSCYVYKAEPVYNPSAAGLFAGPGIKILVTNDVHGYAFHDNQRRRLGYAVLQGHADRLRQDGWEVILMDAGDAFSGNSIAHFDNGRSIAEIIGAMGYRILTPGNHAFDYNIPTGNDLYYSDVLLPIVRQNAPGPVDAVAQNLTRHGQPLPGLTGEPVELIDMPGFRLVVTGLLTPYTKVMTNAAGLAGFDFGLVELDGQPDHDATRLALTDKLRTAVWQYDLPGDVVVVLSHLGHDDTDSYRTGQVNGRDLATVRNVDIVVDAHSHNYTPVERIGDALYGNAGRYLEKFTEITVNQDAAGAIAVDMAIWDYDALRDTAPSEFILMKLRAMSDRLALGDRVFTLGSDQLHDRNVGRESTPLGRFVCRAYRDIADADIAILNSGSLRSGLAPGQITAGAIYDMLPFQNNLVTYALTGQEIADLVEPHLVTGTNAFPEFYGMTVHAFPTGEGGRFAVAGITGPDGAPLSMDKTYTVAVNSYMAEGGDGYVLPPGAWRHVFGARRGRFIDHGSRGGRGGLGTRRTGAGGR